MRFVSFGVMAAIFAASPVFADPREDAEAIVDATIRPDIFEAAFEAVGGLLVGNIQNEIRNAGKEMSPQAAKLFGDMFIDASTQEMVAGMRGPLVDVYVANFSEQMLSDYRAFLESDSGREMMSKQSALMLESARVGEIVGADVAIPALETMTARLTAGDVPSGTLKTVENELKHLLGVQVDTPPP